MADDTYYMKQALMEAQKAAEEGEVPVGAVVVCRDRIIARAHNLTETLTDVTAHAEMQAIGDNGCCQCVGWEILERLYAIRDSRTLRDVCGSNSVGADTPSGVWSGRRKAGLSEICTKRLTPQNRSGERRFS